jgi:hypothetical protein
MIDFITVGGERRIVVTRAAARVNVENMPPRRASERDNSNAGFVNDVWLKLLCCLMLDMVGFFSFLLPALGELSDLAWGPISAFLLYRLFPNMPMMAVVNLAEETLPFLDFVPTATIAWWLQHGRQLAATPKPKQDANKATPKKKSNVKIVDVTNEPDDVEEVD